MQNRSLTETLVMESVAQRGGDSHRAWSGIAVVISVSLTILGGVLLAGLDSDQSTPRSSAQIAPATVSPMPTLIIVLLPSPELDPTRTPSPSSIPKPSATAHPSPVPSVVEEQCPPPPGWILYTVRSGDTLHSLATRDGASVDAIIAANCLTAEDLAQGDLLYLPSTPSPLPTVCSGPPQNWERYTVRPGDTMFSLAAGRGATIYEVLRANCLSSSRIRAGQTLYLPPTPAHITLTAPPSASPTPSLPGPTTRPFGSVCAFVSPADGANIDGHVSFAGTATADQFLFFKLEAYGPETSGQWASLLGGVVRTPVVGGALGTTDLTGWSPGSYSIRLTVVDTTYNEVSHCYLGLNVSPP